MDLVTKMVVSGAEAEACWLLYDRAFEELRTRAAQRHAMTRDEFDDVMVDGRVTKHITSDPGTGRPCGLATLTNDLKAVPLISPEFYEHRWPQYYARQEIWYIGFVAVDPEYHGTRTVGRLIGSLTATIPEHGGILAADICSVNENAGLPDMFARLTGKFDRPQADLLRLDAQTYWGYEFASSV